MNTVLESIEEDQQSLRIAREFAAFHPADFEGVRVDVIYAATPIIYVYARNGTAAGAEYARAQARQAYGADGWRAIPRAGGTDYAKTLDGVKIVLELPSEEKPETVEL